MTNNFDIIRSELLKEKAYSEELLAANKRLKEEVDRHTRSSRGSKSKLDDLERLYVQQLNNGEEMQKKLLELQDK